MEFNPVTSVHIFCHKSKTTIQGCLRPKYKFVIYKGKKNERLFSKEKKKKKKTPCHF